MKTIRANDISFKAEFVSPIREPQGIHIVVEDNRNFAEIAQDFINHDRIEVSDSLIDGITIYEGYTEITSMYKRGERVTIVLSKK